MSSPPDLFRRPLNKVADIIVTLVSKSYGRNIIEYVHVGVNVADIRQVYEVARLDTVPWTMTSVNCQTFIANFTQHPWASQCV